MSERIWACITDSLIVNTVVGDDDFAALITPDFDSVVEITDLDPRAGVKWTVHPDGYRPSSPFPSWVWSGSEWEAPTPRPTTPGVWSWDEDAQEWIDTTPPEA